MSSADRLARAARYQQALGDGVLAEAFATVEQQIADELLNTFDATQRDNLWRSVQCLRKVSAHLSTVAAGGRLAQHQLEELKRVAASR